LFNIFFGYWNIKTLGKFCNLLKAQFFLWVRRILTFAHGRSGRWRIPSLQS
jgi:hypothetical protein